METFSFNRTLSRSEIIKKMYVVRKIRENHRTLNEVCRICLESNNLISPCSCTHGYFHKECLDRWRLSHHRNNTKRYNCEICLDRYDYIVITPEGSRSSSPRPRRVNIAPYQLTRYEKLSVAFLPVFTLNICGYVILAVYLLPYSWFSRSQAAQIVMFAQSTINSLYLPFCAWLFKSDTRCLPCSTHIGLQAFLGGVILMNASYAVSSLPIIDDVVCAAISSVLCLASFVLNILR